MNILNFDDSDIIKELEAESLAVANQFRYISKYGKYPVYKCYEAKYYDMPYKAYKEQLEAAGKARKSICLEYLAIKDSIIFEELLMVLKECVERGVRVRIIYDYLGSFGFKNPEFVRKLKNYGIDCRVFNGLGTNIIKFVLNRDHQKIMIIDDEIAFIGGYNLADEYFGVTNPYGKWQDTGFSFKGPAVLTMTAIFEYMWESINKDTNKNRPFIFPESKLLQTKTSNTNWDGFIQPYLGSPYDKELLAENIYLNVIKAAKKYVYIITPYLIPSKVMIRELSLAAKRGVDVRILIPGIPDKKTIYRATCSYLYGLANSEVNIYKYTPGFCHAKQFVCDDEIAVIGSINLDGRSLHRDFENAVLLYKVSAIKDMYEDFQKLFMESENVTGIYMQKNKKPSIIRRIYSKLTEPFY